MNAQYRRTIFALLAVLVFAVTVWLWQQRVEMPLGSVPRSDVLPVGASNSITLSEKGDGLAVATSASSEKSPHSARGAGYVWGSALRRMFAVSTINPSGKRHLDVTVLEKSFQQFQRPMNLEDASALPLARAEYLASVITAALDLPLEYQAQLAELLQGSYDLDWHSRGLPHDEQEKERARIAAIARDQLLRLLPAGAHESFAEIFASKDFLFRSMSFATDEVTLEMRGGTAIATGGVTFTVDPGGAIRFEAAETSFQSKGDKPRRRMDAQP